MPDEPRLFLIGKNVTLTARVAIEVAVAERFSPTPLWANVSISAFTMVGAVFIPQIYILYSVIQIKQLPLYPTLH
jgi:hypothetical protein